MSRGNKKAAKPVSRFRNAENGTYTKQAAVVREVVAPVAKGSFKRN